MYVPIEHSCCFLVTHERGRLTLNRFLVDTEEQKAEFAKDPVKYHRYHKTVEKSLNGRFRTLLRDTAESDEVNAVSQL
jgi:hypothetical protein